MTTCPPLSCYCGCGPRSFLRPGAAAPAGYSSSGGIRHLGDVVSEMLAGRYRRIRSLGTGGMGEVWLAEDTELGRSVAVKHLHASNPADLNANLIDRMLREARVAARLRHPNIVMIFDIV